MFSPDAITCKAQMLCGLVTLDCVGHCYRQADRGRPAAFDDQRAAALAPDMAIGIPRLVLPPMETDLEPLRLLTLKQTAELLRVSPQVVRVIIQRNELLAFKVGRQWRIRSMKSPNGLQPIFLPLCSRLIQQNVKRAMPTLVSSAFARLSA